MLKEKTITVNIMEDLDDEEAKADVTASATTAPTVNSDTLAPVNVDVTTSSETAPNVNSDTLAPVAPVPEESLPAPEARSDSNTSEGRRKKQADVDMDAM